MSHVKWEAAQRLLLPARVWLSIDGEGKRDCHAMDGLRLQLCCKPLELDCWLHHRSHCLNPRVREAGAAAAAHAIYTACGWEKGKIDLPYLQQARLSLSAASDFGHYECPQESCVVSCPPPPGIVPFSPVTYSRLCFFSLTACAIFAYLLGLFVRSNLVHLENQTFIITVTVVCATVLLLVLWNTRSGGAATSSPPFESNANDELPSSSAKSSSSSCCNGVCNGARAAAATSHPGACCQDNSDAASVASSVGSHKGMSKDAFHQWKRENPEE